VIIDITKFLAPPEPISTHVAHVQGMTAISRLWDPEDGPRCRRCPECHAAGNTCLVVVPWHVADDDAADFTFPPPSEAQRRARPSAS
jgi:hypothetical protein